LVEATVRYLNQAASAGIEIVVMDSGIPYVPSLLAFGYREQEIARIVDQLRAGIGAVWVLVVFLDGDAAVGCVARALGKGRNGWAGMRRNSHATA
jgi:hypothetical protein